ncbi:ComEC/Rec2 family competence protein [Sunxiuqinia sp. A32]|uniref:ComEC/Rec2 family competence protein n=1 Tax=Sunxiuqinia sp. A32 TaxID=3461496 RepID=UPI0040461595
MSSLIILLACYFTDQNRITTVHENYQGNISAILLQPPLEKNKTYQLSVKICIADSSSCNNSNALLYVRKNNRNKNIEVGDKIVGRGTLNRIENNGNPFEFDYAGYMAKQGYYFSAFLSDEDFRLTGKSNLTPTILAEKIRSKLLDRLRSHIKNNDSFQVISALTLGYRKELSKEIKTYFASTGAMHVLAVSGLHVGMIFLLLSRILFFLKRSKSGRFAYVLSIGTILWFYALLTGFSPSVQRATVMFSFLLIGSSLKRPASIYNSLAASAFILLHFNPNLFFEVGFQLSYMAVISIVFFYPRFEKILSPKSWLINKIWQLFCVSVAAQIGTFALSIFYFHQFPVYFWLSNFIVIPAAYLILGLTIILLLFIWLPTLASIIGFLLELVTNSTISILKQIEQLPYSLIEGISISTLQLICLISCSFLLMFFIKWKRKSYLFAALLLLFIFQMNGIINKSQHFNQHKIIVYKADSWTIHLINGRENYLIYDAKNQPSSYTYHNVITKLELNEPIPIENNHFNQLKIPHLLIKNDFIQFSNTTIQIISDNQLKLSTAEQAQPQVVFLKEETNISTNPTLHNIDAEGAFIIDL